MLKKPFSDRIRYTSSKTLYQEIFYRNADKTNVERLMERYKLIKSDMEKYSIDQLEFLYANITARHDTYNQSNFITLVASNLLAGAIGYFFDNPHTVISLIILYLTIITFGYVGINFLSGKERLALIKELVLLVLNDKKQSLNSGGIVNKKILGGGDIKDECKDDF